MSQRSPGAAPSTDRTIRAAVPAAALDAIRRHAPSGAEVVALDDDLDLETIDFLVPIPRNREVADRLPGLTRLSVIQMLSAGSDWVEPVVPPGAYLCNARGARDGPVAEWVLAALLGAGTGLLRYAHERTWEPRSVIDLAGSTVVIVGFGSIGRRVAANLAPFQATVIGVGSRARDGVHGPEELPELLGAADAMVILAPLTDATRGMIGAAELARLRDGAVVINAGRGPVLDTDALLAELTQPRLYAVLDVTDPEPLAADHPLWRAPGTLAISPHMSGVSAAANARAVELAGEQLARWAAGEPLLNVVVSPKGS